jgi:hypothetical protein
LAEIHVDSTTLRMDSTRGNETNINYWNLREFQAIIDCFAKCITNVSMLDLGFPVLG